MQETYWSEPQGTYEERRQQYLEYCATRVFDGRVSLN